MGAPCEICGTLSRCTGALVTSRHHGLFHVIVGSRLLELCLEHADEVCGRRIQSLDELYAYYLEPFPGQRSLVPRRARAPQIPGRPGGRRAYDQPNG